MFSACQVEKKTVLGERNDLKDGAGKGKRGGEVGRKEAGERGGERARGNNATAPRGPSIPPAGANKPERYPLQRPPNGQEAPIASS